MTTLLTEQWVRAIPKLRIEASWSNLQPQYRITPPTYYSPPPGWVIMNKDLEVHSQSNGSTFISDVAGGFKVASTTEVNTVFQDAMRGEFAYKGVEFKAKIVEKRESTLKAMDAFEVNQQTIRLQLAAEAHGTIVDRKRGWNEVTAWAYIKKIGADQQDLRLSLVEEFGSDVFRPARTEYVICRFRNDLSDPIEFWFQWSSTHSSERLTLQPNGTRYFWLRNPDSAFWTDFSRGYPEVAFQAHPPEPGVIHTLTVAQGYVNIIETTGAPPDWNSTSTVSSGSRKLLVFKRQSNLVTVQRKEF